MDVSLNCRFLSICGNFNFTTSQSLLLSSLANLVQSRLLVIDRVSLCAHDCQTDDENSVIEIHARLSETLTEVTVVGYGFGNGLLVNVNKSRSGHNKPYVFGIEPSCAISSEFVQHALLALCESRAVLRTSLLGWGELVLMDECPSRIPRLNSLGFIGFLVRRKILPVREDELSAN